MSTPALSNMFVSADGVLAEFLCHVGLLGLTEPRAVVLHALHRDHRPDECSVVTATEVHLP
ncbi:hypothetical protein IU474_16730 [Nocardia otitidiscaviarum]|nr:hypothetical protein [Nocardia otitidiscaviarum]